jgi:hypothetical protein
MTLIQTWVPRKEDKKRHQFRMFYQITVAGKQQRVPMYDVGMMRNKLSRERKYIGNGAKSEVKHSPLPKSRG